MGTLHRMKKLSKKQRLLQVQTNHLFVFGCVVVVVCMAAWYAMMQAAATAQPQRLVTVYDRGVKRSVLTQAGTVGGALRFAGITLDPHDIVEPSTDMKLTTTDADVIVYRSRLIAVQDGNIRQTVMTAAQSPNEILKEAGLEALDSKDETEFKRANAAVDGAPTALVVSRAKQKTPAQVTFQPKPNALTKSKGAQVYVDASGVAHRETYYDLPMAIVIRLCGASNTYTIRSDGAKIDQDGYVLIAANLAAYPRCTVVDTSLGPGKVYDTGGFAAKHPYGFDLATDWSNGDGI